MDEITHQQYANLNWRVKVYLLNSTGNWDDCGTGTLDMVKENINGEEIEFLQVASYEDKNQAGAIPIPSDKLLKLKGNKDDEKYLLHRPLMKLNQFEKQGESIISWIDKDIDEEIAISFLDLTTAKEVWRVITMRLGKNPMDDKKNNFTDLDKLPMPTMENLRRIRTQVESNRDWMICAILKNPAFLDKLFELFRDLEDLESYDNLYLIHDILKIMIFSDDLSFLELLLSDEYYLLVFGALECKRIRSDIFVNVVDDSDHQGPFHPRYRDFLKNHSYYKKVIEFKDSVILRKIHLNFRLSYLRDSVIGSIIDDPLTSQFNTVIYYNNSEIYEYLMQNPEYLDQLFTNFFSNLKDSIGFLFELVQIVKMIIQVQTKEIFCEKMAQRDIFTVIARAFAALNNPNDEELADEGTRNILKINLVGILFFIIQSQINSFIDFLKLAPESQLMITGLTENVFYGDQGLQIQITEVFRYMTDSQHERKNETLDLFYHSVLPVFLEHYNQMENNEKFYSFVQQYIEILVHCVRLHNYRIRHYITQHKLLHVLYKGFNVREKSVSLAIIRLVKNIVICRDDFLSKYIINNNLLDDIFEVYLKNCRKDNLLSSACLEFFTTLAKEKLNKLIIHFVSRFREKIQEYGLENIFHKIFAAYEQINNGMIQEELLDLPHTQGDHVTPALLPENQQELNSRELTCMEDEEYFEAEEEKKFENGKHLEKQSNNNNRGGFLIEDNFSGAESDTSEADFSLARDNLIRLRGKLHKKTGEDEGERASFHANAHKGMSRTTSMDKISNKIDIHLNLRSMSEDNASPSDYNTDEINVKRWGSDLENDEDIRGESQMEPHKRVKL